MRILHLDRKGVGAGRVLFALYRAGGQIVFSAGALSWSLASTAVRFEFSPDRDSSSFKVFYDDAQQYACTYHHWIRSLYARHDPTYDGIDFDTDHFLSHVAQLRLPVPDRPDWIDARPRTAYR